MVEGKGKEGVEKVECNLDLQKGQVMRGIRESDRKKQKNKLFLLLYSLEHLMH